MVPYSAAGKSKVDLVVEYRGRRTNVVSLPVSEAAPGIFTLDESGRGPALARTEDYQFSDVNNPIPPGSEMILYLTGEGVSIPAGIPEGQTLRLRGKGAPLHGEGEAGDALVR